MKNTARWNHVTASPQNSQHLDSDEPNDSDRNGLQDAQRSSARSFAVSFHKELSREDIERRAFQIYMAGGRQPGNDIADWVAAEKELREAYWRVALTAFNKAA